MRVGRIIAIVLLIAVVGFAATVWAYNRYVTYQSNLVAWPAKEVGDVNPRAWQPKDPRTIRILSLDGGGIRGLIALEVLRYLEEKSGKPIAELFDVIGGTSTGAIIGTQLVLADDQGKPRYKASDIIKIYDDQVARVFRRPWYHQLLTLDGLLGPRYANHHKVSLANELYADANFRDFLLPVMIPSYSVGKADLEMFNNWSPDYAEMFVAPLVSAATSGPTYFPAVELQLPSGSGIYMDGAVYGADPAQEILLHALEQYPNAEIVMVSLGTGIPDFALDAQAGERGGILTWAQPLMRIVVDGRGDLASTWLERFSKTEAGDGFFYYRFDTHVPSGAADFDNTAPEVVAYLTQTGQSLTQKSKQQLDEAIDRLTGS
jgi:predicted acylesterase/phospholipase RssA